MRSQGISPSYFLNVLMSSTVRKCSTDAVSKTIVSTVIVYALSERWSSSSAVLLSGIFQCSFGDNNVLISVISLLP